MATTVQLDDPQGIINSLQERIKQLEGELARERQHPLDILPGAITDTLKYVRGHYGVILLHVGREELTKVRQWAERPAERAALDQAWNLASAPLSDEIKAALRLAADYGDNRWY